MVSVGDRNEIEPLLLLLSKTDTYLKSETHFPILTFFGSARKVDRVGTKV